MWSGFSLFWNTINFVSLLFITSFHERCELVSTSSWNSLNKLNFWLNLWSPLMCVCVSGLSLESETGLSPIETDTDSHKPLMSDEEDEVEVEKYSRRGQSVEQPVEPPAESPQAIGFLKAFCLPGVLPVSVKKTNYIKLYNNVFIVWWLCLACTAVFPGLCMSEAGQLLLLLLASLLLEQQLQVEGSPGRPPVCVVWCRRNHR